MSQKKDSNSKVVFNDTIVVEYGEEDTQEIPVTITPDLTGVPEKKHAAIMKAILIRYKSNVEAIDRDWETLEYLPLRIQRQ